MKRAGRPLAAAALIAVPAAIAQEETPVEVPFFLPVPEGWRTETIPLPPEFAVDLAHQGLEELRFAPGMFDPEAEDFWTYAFVWWIPANTSLDAETLTADLDVYFRGLLRAVAGSREQDLDESLFSFRIRAGEASGGRPRFEGTVRVPDAFVTQEPVTMNCRVEIGECPAAERTVAFFEFSPRPTTHDVWKALAGIREGFLCTAGDSGAANDSGAEGD